MNLRVVLCLCCVMLRAPCGLAQDAMQREEFLYAVVRVEALADHSGSGLIVSTKGGSATILTARHVVEVERGTLLQDRRDCSLTPAVTYYGDTRSVPATRAVCSDELDIAALTVPVPPALEALLPRFRHPQGKTDTPGAPVMVLGLALGNEWVPFAQAMVKSGSEARELRLSPEIEHGYSGGAVLDTQQGFLGMVVRSGGGNTFATRRDELTKWLRGGGFATDRIEAADSATELPMFSIPAENALEDGARAAVRQFRHAFNYRNPSALLAVYPNVGAGAVADLIDDTVLTLMDLTACTDGPDTTVTSASGTRRTVTCEFRREIIRRTGPPQCVQSRGFEAAQAKAAAGEPAETRATRPPVSAPWLISKPLCVVSRNKAFDPMLFRLEFRRDESRWRIVGIDDLERPADAEKARTP